MYINQSELTTLLEKQDLTINNNHCISLVVEKIKEQLEKKYNMIAKIERGSKVVSINDNYYALGYQNNEVTLGVRYTKYINNEEMLRTQMSSTIPSLLRSYKKDGDKLYISPGVVYRRDVRDKTHVGEPHQMDIWYLTKQQKSRKNLLELVQVIIDVIEKSISKKIEWRYKETTHNYTDDGIEVEIKHNGNWLEILECGLISKKLLKNHDLQEYSGLALGLGLERLVMIIKSIEDIRVLYQNHPIIQAQMKNLEKYKPVSNQPSTKRDMSIAIDENINEEEVTELVLNSLNNDDISIIESINVVSETSYKDLNDIARQRLGIIESQKNILIRVILRDLITSIESGRANHIYNVIYKNIHKGNVGYIINS